MNNSSWTMLYRLFPSPPAFRLRTVVYGCCGAFVLTPAFRPHVYTHLFAQVYERGVKSAMLRAVRAKARIGVCLHPSLKAGVNERQIVDHSIRANSCLFVSIRGYLALTVIGRRHGIR